MAELAMLADIQRTVYPDEVTRQLHVMAQGRESLPVIDRRSNHCATPRTIWLITSYNCVAVHTMVELKMTGNCMKGSRPLLSFDTVCCSTTQHCPVNYSISFTIDCFCSRLAVDYFTTGGNIIRTAVCWIVWHNVHSQQHTYMLSLIHIWRCRRIERCRSRWSPYH